VTAHVIEVSSRCQLSSSCVWCPQHAALTRPRRDISDEDFSDALRWVDPGQAELNLSGVGEPLMHPRFVELLAEARGRFPTMRLLFPTNGLLLTRELAERLVPYHPEVSISLHVPEKAAHAVQIARHYGLLAGVSMDPVLNPNDCAGQVDWYPSEVTYPCPWVGLQRYVVASTGDILTCCFDFTGESRLAHVQEEPRQLTVKPWRVCERCHQTMPTSP
jgi:hypothetical protein